jgi:hypothetical protein
MGRGASPREHAVVPEPFLLGCLIAAIRRVLVLTTELGQSPGSSDATFRHFVIELGVLTLLILALAISLDHRKARDGERPGGSVRMVREARRFFILKARSSA